MKHVFFLSFLLIFFSCEEKKQFEKTELSYEVIEEIQLKLDSITSPLTIRTQLIESDSGTFLYTMHSQQMSMNIYNLQTKKNIKKIKFSHDGINRIGLLQGFDVYNKDTLLVATYPPHLVIFDHAGNKINELIVSGEDQYIQTIESTNALPFFIFKNKIYGAYPFITRYWETPIKEVSNFRHVYEIDFKNMSIQWKNLSLPSRFWDKGKISPEFSWTSKGDSIITVFKENAQIQVFSINQNQLLNILDLKTPEKIDFIKFQQRPTGNEGAIKQLGKGAFRSIHYDKYRRVYYVFYDLPVDPEQFTIPISKLHSTRPDHKIFLLDENFEYIGEHTFKEFSSDPYDAFVGKKGLYLPTNREYSDSFDEDYLKFKVIQFKKPKE
ncbi:hypothetical protein Belba_1451 [Belliella baltica DSM 15883]|uniref:DUF4221 domain-containing protein n=1 Tax=Belliella baltica (strain DSM 15883 / CIP 108006 / LMG 21964 / BA134) TaxID=866536 RepID=I3Z4A0_BELBD|nr:DUF4221 family protein [Belliella baltica]AFL84068.1 hypothetical protein Belba_1451 [Belliella baltica DSM 15883]